MKALQIYYDYYEYPDGITNLDDFVKYLQEKPFSREASYLAKEKHDTICCFRCGHVYKFLEACPKCGFKTNEQVDNL